MDFLFDEHGFFIKKVRILSFENDNITQTAGSVNMDFLETILVPSKKIMKKRSAYPSREEGGKGILSPPGARVPERSASMPRERYACIF